MRLSRIKPRWVRRLVLVAGLPLWIAIEVAAILIRAVWVSLDSLAGIPFAIHALWWDE